MRSVGYRNSNAYKQSITNFDGHAMPREKLTLTLILLLYAFVWPGDLVAEQPLVIAHRGASGYLPEHTLEAKAMAHAMGADYIEQDVVLTKDDQPVVLHDIHLDTVTNVAEIFPARARDDGRFYAIDFTLAEIKRLTATERINLKTGKAVYSKRFPAKSSSFKVPTLAEEIELIQGMNKSTGREAGIYPEIKAPDFHRKAGKDISRIVLDTVHRYGYRGKDDKCFVQCFDLEETRRLREELDCKLQIVQLMGGTGYAKSSTAAGLQKIAEYADGVGPSLALIFRMADGEPQVTSFVADAHEAGLVVHPYTLRADELPKLANSYSEFVQAVYVGAQVDGAFTDFPDQTVAALKQLDAK
jgi:glycerophosphoryl diester phosphodiesterase